jgi:hypothetical protein
VDEFGIFFRDKPKWLYNDGAFCPLRPLHQQFIDVHGLLKYVINPGERLYSIVLVYWYFYWRQLVLFVIVSPCIIPKNFI